MIAGLRPSRAMKQWAPRCAWIIALVAAAAGTAVAAPADADARAWREKAGHLKPALLERLDAGIVVDLLVEFSSEKADRYARLRREQAGLDEADVSVLAGKKALFAATKADAVGVMPVAGVTLLADYDALPVQHVSVASRAALVELLQRRQIVRVHANEGLPMALLESLPLIRQPVAQAAGHSGAGTTIAILDTGADFQRAEFGPCQAPGVPANCRVAAALEFAPNDGQLDDNGHGTNVSAIALAVAPGSRIISADVFRSDQLAYPNEITAAINWVINNRAAFNIVAMNLSLGSDANDPGTCRGDWASAPFTQARAAGILPIVAAGNSARLNGLASPACASGAISVGAVYDAAVGARSFTACQDPVTAADQVTCFSNSSLALGLLAPGALITAGGWIFSGTSQAAPHVAGAVAVLRAAFPGESAEAAYNRLLLSGRPVRDARNGLTKARIDLGRAATDLTIRPALTLTRWATQQGGFWDAQKWFAGDFNGDGKADVGKVFDEGGYASVDIHLSSGNAFNIARWATRQGGYWSSQKWVTGDFNGDGKTDLAKAFNCGDGNACIDVHLSGGGSFTMQRWANSQGGYWDSQFWMAGDFNGDGKTDLAKVWDDGGMASIDVHFSNGTSFYVYQRWATRQGGYASTQRWMAGDFDGDGKTDLAKAFDDGSGQIYIDVHRSSGSTFVMQRWANAQGGFSSDQKWVAGDFNGDGRTDLAKAWDDGGLIDIDIHYSMGNSFNLARQATRQGGFSAVQKWLAGDFTGDRKAEIGKALLDNGAASIDVHR